MIKKQNYEKNNTEQILKNYKCEGQLRFVGIELHIEEETKNKKNDFKLIQ
ncbi:hypothetical protein [Lacrimispora amygdalina]|nr:hypothetical protein [Lacrimispora amygdalina]